MTRSLLKTCAIIAIVLVNLAVLLRYQFIGYRAIFHSDAAVKNLLAQEIFETGRFFPPDWHYANHDLMVWFGHLFILPFLPWLPNDFSLHAVSGVVSLPFILGATWLLGRMLELSPVAQWGLLAVMTSGISPYFQENLYGQVSYAVPYYLAGLTLVAAWQVCRVEGRNFLAQGLLGSLLVLLAFLGACANPGRALASYGLPLLLGAAFLGLRHWSLGDSGCISPRRLGLLAAEYTVGLLLGTWAYWSVTQSLPRPPGALPINFVEFEAVLQNLARVPQGLLYLFGGLPEPGTALVSLKGLYQALRTAVALAFVVGLCAVLCRALASKQASAQWVAVFGATGLISVLFLMTFTSLPGSAHSPAASRYYVPALLVLTPLVLWHLDRSRRPDDRRGVVLDVVLGACLIVFIAFGWHHYENPAPGFFQRHRAIGPIADKIEQAAAGIGLEYGYATFWQANAMTVLSGGRLKVRPISIQDGRPVPLRHLSSERWYRPDAWQGPSFLLLSNAEFKSLDSVEVQAWMAAPGRVIPVEDFVLVVYPSNIATRLPHWDEEFTAALRIPVTSRSFHRVGRLLLDGENPPRLVADTGENGAVLHGPYVPVAPGEYLASYDLAVTPSSGRMAEPAGRIDIYCAATKRVIAERTFGPSIRGALGLEFSLQERCAGTELRVFSNGSASIQVYGTALVKTSRLQRATSSR